MPVDSLQNLINEIKDLKRRIKTLETAPSQQNMTVDKGATRILSDDGLQIGAPGSSNGSAVVYGVLTIVGTLNGDGTVDWEGTISQLGATNLRGPVAITGEDGTLEVDAETLLRGVTRMLADLNVESGGKIIAGNVTVEPNKITVGGGASPATIQDSAMSFATGGKLEADTENAGIRMIAGDAVVNAGNTASIRKGNASVVAGPLGVDINAAALRLLVNAPISLTPALIPTVSGTGLPANVIMMTSTGAVRRTV